jgi:catechol 2,3-dioxygenase-like lactoylglutathione lyase family enzyme
MAKYVNDDRPLAALGHVALDVSDIDASTEFFVGLVIREIVRRDEFAVLELRGGSHIQLLRAKAPIPPGTKIPFDLMVDDNEATRKEYEARGLQPSGFEKGHIHTEFTIPAPDGYILTMTSSHTSGRVM